MKKILLSLLLLLSCCSSCSLKTKTYHYIHIQMYHTMNPIHYMFTDYDMTSNGSIKFVKEDGETIYVSSSNAYLLYNTEKCPMCGKVYYK